MNVAKQLALAVLILTSAVVCAQGASADELIVNGDFESGSFLGWTEANKGSGSWFVDVPGTTTPLSGNPTMSTAANGAFYAVTDQGGGGTHVLYQDFSVVAGSDVVLTFDMFMNDADGGPIFGPLDHTLGPVQYARVDIMSVPSGDYDIGAGVLSNLVSGVDAGPNPHAFTSYMFDISTVVAAGGTFRLRFGEVDNQFFFNQGVDNVSITQTAAVPEPSTFALLLGVFVGGAAVRRRRLARR